MNLSREAYEQFYAAAEASFQKIRETKDTSILVHYAGDLNFGFSNALASRLEKILEERIEDKQARKRFFSVFVEVVQNIRIHGTPDDHDTVHGMVTVFRRGDQLCSKFGNILTNSEAEELMKRYDGVNSMERDDLKKLYMETMMSGPVSEKGGAGLGVITIVLRSQNPSPYLIIPLTPEYCIFQSEICVDIKHG